MKHMKFGIQILESIEEVKGLDVINGNRYWSNAIKKGTDIVRKVFQLLDRGMNPPVLSKKIRYRVIFDVKFELIRKPRFVAYRYQNKTVSQAYTYSIVV